MSARHLSQTPQYFSQTTQYFSQTTQYFSQTPQYFSQTPQYFSQKTRSLPFRTVILSVFVLTAALLLSSCTWGEKDTGEDLPLTKKESPARDSLLSSSLLKKLSPATAAFVVWKEDKELSSSLPSRSVDPSKLDQVFELIGNETGSASSSELFPILTRWAIEESLFTVSPSQPADTRQGVAFLEVKQDLPVPGVAVYLESNGSVGLVDKLEPLRNQLTEAGYKTEDLKSGEASGFSLSLQKAAVEQAAPSGAGQLLFAADQNHLSIATSLPLLRRAFEDLPPEENGYQVISETQSFKDLVSYLKLSGEDIGFAYLDGSSVMRTAEAASQSLGGSSGAFAGSVSVTAGAWRYSIEDTIQQQVLIELREEDPYVKKILASVNGASKKKAGSASESAGAVAAVDLYQGLLSAVRAFSGEASLANNSPELGELLDSTESVSLGVLPMQSASLFPGVYLVLQSPDAEQAKETVKGLLSNLLRQQMKTEIPWQQVQKEQLKIESLISPLGIGLFLAHTDVGLVLSTSQETVVKIADSQAGSARRVEQGSTVAPLMRASFDGPAVANIITGIQGNLALFTGGEALVRPSDLDDIRNMGETTYQADLFDRYVSLQSRTRPYKEVTPG